MDFVHEYRPLVLRKMFENRSLSFFRERRPRVESYWGSREVPVKPWGSQRRPCQRETICSQIGARLAASAGSKDSLCNSETALLQKSEVNDNEDPQCWSEDTAFYATKVPPQEARIGRNSTRRSKRRRKSTSRRGSGSSRGTRGSEPDQNSNDDGWQDEKIIEYCTHL